MFALMFVLQVASHLHEHASTMVSEEVDTLLAEFGSVSGTMLNLFACSTGGTDWMDFFSLLTPTGSFNEVVFLGCMAFTQIAVLNIILGLFVDDAMKHMGNEREEKAQMHAEEQLLLEQDLRAMCHEADLDGTGKISLQEWEQALVNGKMHSYLDMMGFRVHDVMEFFRLLAKHEPTGDIDIGTFVRGCMRLKGSASSFDMQSVVLSTKAMSSRLHRQEQLLQKLLDDHHRQLQQSAWNGN